MPPRRFPRSRRLEALAITASVLLLSGAAPGRSSTAPLSITITGPRFVNGAGQKIRLLGANVSSSEYACVDGYGYDDGYFTPATAAAIASWRANAVRVPLNEDCWLGINGQPSGSDGAGHALTQAGYQQEIERFVADLNARGLYAILDLHWTAPGSLVADSQEPMPDAHSVAFWSSVATTFKDNHAVVFDVFNEPFDPTDPRSGDDTDPSHKVSWSCWADGGCTTATYHDNGSGTVRTGGVYQVAGMQDLVNAIRSAGATQPVLVGGLNYSNDLTQWADHAPNDPLNREAASFHNYQGQVCDTNACWRSTIASVARYVPVVTGEFGQDNYDQSTCKSPAQPRTFDQDFMNWADSAGVSYLAWAWIVETPSEQSDAGCSAYVLISNYDGAPAAPNGTALHDHLQQLAAAGGGPGPEAAVQLAGFAVTVLPGGAQLEFRLRSPETCSGTLSGQTVKAYRSGGTRHPVALGAVHFKLPAGQSTSVALRLSGAARKLLAGRRSLAVRFTITLTSPGRRRTILQRGAVLAPPRGR